MLNKELWSSCSQKKHVQLQQHRKNICRTMSKCWFLVRNGTGAGSVIIINKLFVCNLPQQA